MDTTTLFSSRLYLLQAALATVLTLYGLYLASLFVSGSNPSLAVGAVLVLIVVVVFRGGRMLVTSTWRVDRVDEALRLRVGARTVVADLDDIEGLVFPEGGLPYFEVDGEQYRIFAIGKGEAGQLVAMADVLEELGVPVERHSGLSHE